MLYNFVLGLLPCSLTSKLLRHIEHTDVDLKPLPHPPTSPAPPAASQQCAVGAVVVAARSGNPGQFGASSELHVAGIQRTQVHALKVGSFERCLNVEDVADAAPICLQFRPASTRI